MGILIAGYSGHSYVVLDSIQTEVVGYLDKTEADSNPYDLDYLGSELEESVLNEIREKGDTVIVCIGNNQKRARAIELFKSEDIPLVNVIHPSATVSVSAELGVGVFIGPNSVVNAFAHLKDGVIINSSALVEHGCIVGESSHLAPGAVLAGDVEIGKKSFVGANSVVREGIKIGDNVIVGAGSVVVKNLPDETVYFGNPATQQN